MGSCAPEFNWAFSAPGVVSCKEMQASEVKVSASRRTGRHAVRKARFVPGGREGDGLGGGLLFSQVAISMPSPQGSRFQSDGRWDQLQNTTKYGGSASG